MVQPVPLRGHGRGDTRVKSDPYYHYYYYYSYYYPYPTLPG